MKILITGAKGQLGSEFLKKLNNNNNINLLALGKEELDVGNFEQVMEVFESFRPDIVINCSAYNQVDKAETEKELAYRVNAEGPKNLAKACEKYKAYLIHYSTDYVFDGKKEGLYTEDDPPNPLNEYAKSKLMGEKHIQEILENYLIFRVSWVYGEGKQNFLYKLMQWAQTQEYLRIACDEFSVPTSTNTIVEVTLKAIEQGLTGLYHLVNSGYTSRFEWAREFFKLKGIRKFIYPAYQSDFNLPAKRPRFSAMSNEKICKTLGIEIEEWEEKLAKDVLELGI
ncbi:dTDP-4-dehydrorhamnose reductase [Thermocrinis minervae]|uniref:dTDP-4-dehydrorhamnose reductase n=1 Tax=Thermocrinis minervae TaxID=381751 RepID=A0A1M6S9R4_9AQUI|nr:dTDP-4-dehydrorhamnose reductase [Thermocrinis minervae]SHK41524.1 dTDP-4-dehydrorhamnose reductase [Thermocrinis minervae]